MVASALGSVLFSVAVVKRYACMYLFFTFTLY